MSQQLPRTMTAMFQAGKHSPTVQGEAMLASLLQVLQAGLRVTSDAEVPLIPHNASVAGRLPALGVLCGQGNFTLSIRAF